MVQDQLPYSERLALRERVKELTCLYGIAQIAGRPEKPLDQVLQGVVELLPSAWQYPEIAAARIRLDDNEYRTADFRETRQKQSADIVIGGTLRGAVEIVYTENKPEIDEGPFLSEERKLIDEMARQIRLIVERRQAQEDKLSLYAQLRHADRLATIGMLAAGVAHELNEPLANILGFAQLAQKCPGVPGGVLRDLEKIEASSIQARQIIHKLLVFARQRPPSKAPVNLNQVVKDSLYLLESRCAKEGIELREELSGDLPAITADSGQLGQVVVNLVVNALQATSAADTITISTGASDNSVYLVVSDTGIGMSEETIEKIFVPFFTTKDIGQGTGLGLPMVHGIVTSHDGFIRVESKIGSGTRFEIRLPIAETQALEKDD